MSENVLTIENQIATQLQEWFDAHYAGDNALKARKLEALEHFQKLGFPARKSEAYKYTHVTRILEKNIDFSLPPRSSDAWPKDTCRQEFYPEDEANHLVFINGIFNEDYSVIKSPSSALEIRVLDSQAYAEHEEIREYLGNVGENATDAFAALNLSHFNQGLFLKATKRSDNLPTYIYHFLDAKDASNIIYPRILVIGEPSSRLALYEKSFVKGEHNTFSNSVFEAVVRENAEVRYSKIQNYDSNNYTIDGTYAHQAKDSRFYTNTFTFKGAMIRNNIYIAVDDENCEAHMNGLYLISGKSHVDNNTAVDHRKPNSFSNELYKGIVDENARAVFNGRIYVRPDAQKTNAFQSNNNILLSDTATVNTKPQLEIWADDVKCSHGCTTGQLDEEAIFYLRTRGIEKTRAKALMLNAFANEALDELKNELVKEEIEAIILNKLG